jgi:glycosyltransferase involved in cell wall biosynthesis
LTHELPSCTVIVPTFDRPRALAACLDGLTDLDYPKDRLQVVVVDDGSQPPATTSSHGERPTLGIELVRQHHAGPAAARNRGAERATGELLAFIDDDCVPRSDWLRRLAERWRAGDEQGVGGQTMNALAGNLCSEAAQLVIDVGYRQNNHGAPERRWFTTNNLAVAADDFRALGGFDPSYLTAEDRDFCSRWGESGRRLAWEPAAVVEHRNRLGLASFARLHFAYGRGAYRFHRDRRRRGAPIRIEGGYYSRLAREPFRRERAGRAATLLALLVVWHLSNSAGYAWEGLRSTRAPLD